MRMCVLLLLALFASCKKRDKVYNLLTNNGTFKAWDYVIEDSNDVKSGIIISKDSIYLYYYTFYNDSIKVYDKNNDIGYKHYFNYTGDSIYIWREEVKLKMKIFYITEDSLVIDGADSKDNKHIYLVKSKRQEMPMDYEEYKKIYPRPPIKWEVFGLKPPKEDSIIEVEDIDKIDI